MGYSPRFSTGPDGQPRIHIGSAEDLAAATVFMHQAGVVGQTHLLRSLAAGRIAYQSLLPDTSTSHFKAFIRATSTKPTVTLIGDDGDMPTGPAGWRLAQRAIRWAKTVILHGAGAEIEHYESAVIAAQLMQRVLIIECASAHLDAWIALVRAAPHRPSALVIVPRGGVHPLPVERSKMQ
jgi:hypothetical protein